MMNELTIAKTGDTVLSLLPALANRHGLITGATGGIGAALSRRLASAGHTIHAIGRDAAKLAAVSAEIGGTHAVAK